MIGRWFDGPMVRYWPSIDCKKFVVVIIIVVVFMCLRSLNRVSFRVKSLRPICSSYHLHSFQSNVSCIYYCGLFVSCNHSFTFRRVSQCVSQSIDQSLNLSINIAVYSVLCVQLMRSFVLFVLM